VGGSARIRHICLHMTSLQVTWLCLHPSSLFTLWRHFRSRDRFLQRDWSGGGTMWRHFRSCDRFLQRDWSGGGTCQSGTITTTTCGDNAGCRKPMVLYCFVHQRGLRGNSLNLSCDMKLVVSTLNFTRQSGLIHRLFCTSLADTESKSCDLPHHNADRWLSLDTVLSGFFPSEKT
jgi:hypothetical protein